MKLNYIESYFIFILVLCAIAAAFCTGCGPVPYGRAQVQCYNRYYADNDKYDLCLEQARERIRSSDGGIGE